MSCVPATQDFLCFLSNSDNEVKKEEEMRVKKFVSKDKLSKKAKKALNREKRVEWAFKPISRAIPNKKKEAQKKLRPEKHDPDGALEFSGGNHSLDAKEWFSPDPFPRKQL